MSARVQGHSFPHATAMDHDFVARSHYKDAYAVDLTKPDASPVELFHAVFAHRPAWMKIVLIARNWLATRAGLDAPSTRDILQPQVRAAYDVGGSIGAWPIFALTPQELVAGRDNKHLDFRLSVLREGSPESARVVVSTVCAVNNPFGRAYLWLILPFHRWGLRWLMASASSAGRL